MTRRPTIGVDAVVVVAMDEEAEPFRTAASTAGPVTAFGPALQQLLTVAGKTILLVRSGIGLVNAASATTAALLQVSAPRVVSAGSAGGLAADVQVGDVVVSSQTCYSTADATDFGYVLGQVPGMPDRFSCDRTLVDAARTAQTREGLVVSADAFVTARIVDEVRARFPQALSTDMESAAINQVATAFAVPFVSIRGVSDLCGPAADADHATHVDDAADRSANAVLAMLAAL